jgi:cyclic pyranopterin phosphate synthase
MTTETTRLIDPFGRAIEYLRLSVTDRCDLRCRYCMPRGFKAFEEPGDWLTFDEVERIVRAFARLGVHRVRLTGGEPLLRRGLPALAARLHAIPGVDDLSLSTNATQLERHAAALKAAGVARLNVSLDSLRPERVRELCGRDVLRRVLAGLAAARREGFTPIKINMVVVAGVNDDEIEAMAEFCRDRDFVLRLIEAMPIGEAGRSAMGVTLQPIRERLRARFRLVDAVVPGGGPARYLRSPGGRMRIGFITPISQHFCATCNRVRLSVDGTLYLCLGQNDRVALRTLVRRGASDADLEAALRSAIAAKPARHEFGEAPRKIIRFMAQTGG